MTNAHLVFYSYAEYRAFEGSNPAKHEFLGGRIYAMAGGTPEHARLSVEVSTALRVALGRGHCKVYSSDLRIRIPAADLATYPDVSVVCGEVEVASDDPDACINPRLIVEVTSPSSEKYDRGEKLAYYQTLTSVQEVLLVSQDTPFLELHRRTKGGWSRIEGREHGVVELESVNVRLDVDELYGSVPSARS